MTQSLVTSISLATILALAQFESGNARRVRPDVIFDCGIQSLYILSRLEGRSYDLNNFVESQRTDEQAGRSMEELISLAHRSGFVLHGVHLRKGFRPLDRPVIAFVTQAGRGHFLVLRPVGHTGKLVQVLDGVRDPVILDAEEFYASHDWTGLALVPDRPNWPARIAGGAAIASGLGVAAMYLVPRWRGRARRIDPPTETAAAS